MEGTEGNDELRNNQTNLEVRWGIRMQTGRWQFWMPESQSKHTCGDSAGAPKNEDPLLS